MVWGSTVSVGSDSDYSTFPEATVILYVGINIQYIYITICYEVFLVGQGIASR